MNDGMMTDQSAQVAALRLAGVTKYYGNNPAVRGVDFDVMPGEVHALVGENGAGKSTMCKLIAGVSQPDDGHLELEGEPIVLRSPAAGLKAGISMVYQETSLVPAMTVAQNLVMGDERLLNRMRKINLVAQRVLHSHNFHINPGLMVASLSAAQRQLVEIARAVHRDAKIIIFDEPTSSLTPEEKQQLFMTIDELKRRGLAIIYVSHALEECLELGDRITVLRDGQHVATRPAHEFTRDTLVEAMVGRAVETTVMVPRKTTAIEPTLEVRDLTLGQVVRNMSFSAYPGQIVGVAGLVGSGRSESAQIVSGFVKRRRLRGGVVRLDKKARRYRTSRQAIRDGIVYITEDRKVGGYFDSMSIRENLLVGSLAASRRTPFLATARRAKNLEDRVGKRFGIRSLDPKAQVVTLSGGNQQKVTIAKALTSTAKVVIFDEPTKGVDVGAIREIHALIHEFADNGVAVIVISSYLPEILALSDRILVAKGGQIVAEFTGGAATEKEIMFAAVH
ncbi:MAG: sugar ABC transporter ATP-binding protein [Aeromicrobium sp.]|uniref:sugar ABC transporter ATP-binding protein n=1 Tax=Aeromicrobium sp. TaxID=1871063 RepID=UPI00260A3120|nr:sugar ABC transporter ATP-binding protein [Aeromicrobium sp.]MDF1705940.1 sugar ABC transporter ATP-binding protein [Aeromicrobium sp.]